MSADDTPVVELEGGELHHTVSFEWNGEWLDVTFDCPWAPDDPKRPCRMFRDWEADSPQHPVEGCGLIEAHQAGGDEAIFVAGTITSKPEPIHMYWDGDGPAIEALEGGTTDG